MSLVLAVFVARKLELKEVFGAGYAQSMLAGGAEGAAVLILICCIRLGDLSAAFICS